MQGIFEMFTLPGDLERCKTFVLYQAYQHLPIGTRYELVYHPDPLDAYGRVKDVVLCCGREYDQQDTWDVCEHPGYGVPMGDGLYLIARGVIGPDAPALPADAQAYRELRKASVEATLKALGL